MPSRRKVRARPDNARSVIDCRYHRHCGNQASWYREIEHGAGRGSTRVFVCTPCKQRSGQIDWKPWPRGGLR